MSFYDCSDNKSKGNEYSDNQQDYNKSLAFLLKPRNLQQLILLLCLQLRLLLRLQLILLLCLQLRLLLRLPLFFDLLDTLLL
jgi:hypothetical protein